MRLHRKRSALAWRLCWRGYGQLVHPAPGKFKGARKQRCGQVHLAGHLLTSRDGFMDVCKVLIRSMLSNPVPIPGSLRPPDMLGGMIKALHTSVCDLVVWIAIHSPYCNAD